jgi:anaerobic magnesium-protoporphyrin IX monomethyl ester cyclase
MMDQTTLFSATLGEDKKIEPPLGPLYIATALENVGWKVDFRDYQLFDGADAFDTGRILRCLAGCHPVLMISCFVDMLPVVIAAAEAIKSERPGTYIILGGPGPTAGARQLLETFPQLDAIVMGEGEETIQQWARAYGRGQGDAGLTMPIPGMVYRKADRIVDGGPRERILDLQGDRTPAYHLVDWKRYSAGRIITTRGCPYRCSFCDVAPLWGRKAVYRDVVSTVEEMVLLRDRYGRTTVGIADDTFVLNRDRVRAFCHLLIERRVGIEWGCFGRINLMTEDLVELMARAGCRAIFYGIDSGSQRILDRTFKELDPDSILPAIEMSARYFECIEASFIWGYPFETYEDFLLTLDLAANASRFAPTVNIQLHMLSPLPSSPIYQEFGGDLLRPEQEDSAWLLLPSLFLDERGRLVRTVIEKAPHLFPGFFTFPTPDKAAKRDKMCEVRSALEATIGRAIVDQATNVLLTSSDPEIEKELLAAATTATDRIGTGLALGVLRRMRSNRAEQNGAALAGGRTASLVRERNDAVLKVI